MAHIGRITRTSACVIGAVAGAAITSACDSPSGDAPLFGASAQAHTYRCPPASAVGRAVGSPVPAAHRGPVGTVGIICSYVDTDPGPAPIVSVTFGITSDQVPQVAATLSPGGSTEPVSGLGEVALVVTDKGSTRPSTLLAYARGRMVTIPVGAGLPLPTAERVVPLFL